MGKIKFFWRRLALITLLVLSAVIFIRKSEIIINTTPSMQKGIYIKSIGAIARGDIVVLCLKEPYLSIGLERGYIFRGRKCRGARALIKKVVAVVGDNVELTDAAIIVNRQKLNFPTFAVDSRGRTLNAYPRGEYPDTKGYWLIGSADPRSWDSRYWGPIADKQILNKARPLLVWR